MSDWIEKSVRLPSQHPHHMVKIWRGSPEKGRESGFADAITVARDPEIEAWREIQPTDPFLLSADAAASPFFAWLDRAFAGSPEADRITVVFRKARFAGLDTVVSKVEFWNGTQKLRHNWRRFREAFALWWCHAYFFANHLQNEGAKQRPPVDDLLIRFFATRNRSYAIFSWIYLHPVYRTAPSAHQDLDWATDFIL